MINYSVINDRINYINALLVLVDICVLNIKTNVKTILIWRITMGDVLVLTLELGTILTFNIVSVFHNPYVHTGPY